MKFWCWENNRGLRKLLSTEKRSLLSLLSLLLCSLLLDFCPRLINFILFFSQCNAIIPFPGQEGEFLLPCTCAFIAMSFNLKANFWFALFLLVSCDSSQFFFFFFSDVFVVAHEVCPTNCHYCAVLFFSTSYLLRLILFEDVF